jgi:hypothetical protein
MINKFTKIIKINLLIPIFFKMPEIYVLGDRITLPYMNGQIEGILEGISREDMGELDTIKDDGTFWLVYSHPKPQESTGGINVRKDDGTSRFYPLQKLNSVRLAPLKLKGGITDLCVHVYRTRGKGK